MPEFCRVERDGRILTVTLDRPEVLNALHPPANLELEKVFNEFCAGNDLKFQAAGKREGVEIPSRGFAGLTARYDNPKPVIAAVNGVAMGGGFEITLACDLIIASEDATFALPEPRVGLAALAGGVHRLPRQIGLKNAMGMLLTGRRVGAQEGLELGFVNEVVPAGQAVEAAKAWAAQILECAPLSVRASKQAAMQGLAYAGVPEAQDAKYDALREMVKSQDFIEGPKAFAEKRTPNWKGR